MTNTCYVEECNNPSLPNSPYCKEHTAEPQKPICAICGGKYPFPPEEGCYGIRPNKFKKDMPDILICWECVHWLHKDLGEHIRNFSYSLLFVERSSVGKNNIEAKKP